MEKQTVMPWVPVECENEVVYSQGLVLPCGQPATHTVAYDSSKWRGGLDEYFMCVGCLEYVRVCDPVIGAEKLPLPGRIPYTRKRGVSP